MHVFDTFFYFLISANLSPRCSVLLKIKTALQKSEGAGGDSVDLT